MPFRSQAQRRKIAQLEKEGKVKPGTSKKWESETKNPNALPEKKGKYKSIQEVKEVAVKKFGKKK